MASVSELKEIYLVQNLAEKMLAALAPLAEERHFEEKDVVFEEGLAADQFYMLRSGKVLLKVDVNPAVTISLGAIKPGYSFGWSSLMEGMTYTSQAACAEPCEMLVLNGAKFREVLDQDHTMGYQVMDGIVRIMENRLKRRTEQFIKTLRKQMEIWDLF
ncbi:MAG: Crp/Fnr family transcriptional regulator [Desulfarculaceae bacterium]|nr:Crp/Fnr family transcriptional regulator [Desulfarculaceae bacterium]MCF8072987.1 Crp/Fnr family transcriptional regulator [Desulfarculaceae bacterium]MCF8100717.1 Crp/Fnr family transcriptional regulator [Desulfarculaceae bacterium]MCF8115455.1 Crp/Fnr family transcriptional regulator [Desulfarculaceae bacterium]